MTMAFWMSFISNPSAVLHPPLRITAVFKMRGVGLCWYFVATVTPSSIHLIFPCHSSKRHVLTGVIYSLCHSPQPPWLSWTCRSALNVVQGKWRCWNAMELSSWTHLFWLLLCSRPAGSDLWDGHDKYNRKQGLVRSNSSFNLGRYPHFQFIKVSECGRINHTGNWQGSSMWGVTLQF